MIKYVKPEIQLIISDSEDLIISSQEHLPDIQSDVHECCPACDPNGYWHCDHSRAWGNKGSQYGKCDRCN
jgi:hypothetical protein